MGSGSRLGIRSFKEYKPEFFYLLEFLVPVSVGSPYDVFCLLVRGFNVPQRNFPVAGGEHPVKVLFHHGCKLLERRQTAPFQGSDPFPEEFHCPCPGREVPKVVKALLENISLKEPGG